MYTYEQRIMAVKLYQKYGRRAAPVIIAIFTNRAQYFNFPGKVV